MISADTDKRHEQPKWPTDPALARRVQLHHQLKRRRRISDALDELLGMPDRYSRDRYGRGEVAA